MILHCSREPHKDKAGRKEYKTTMKKQPAISPFGVWIKEQSYTRGWNQEKLAEKMIVDPRTIQRWNAGSSRPQPYQIEKIQALFQTSIPENIIRQWANEQVPIDPINFSAAEMHYRNQFTILYHSLQLSGLGITDPSLGEVSLEKIFVQPNLTTERFVQNTPQREAPDQGSKQSVRSPILTIWEPITLSAALQHHFVLIGETGSGKSTFFRWLGLTFAQKRQQEQDRLGSTADADRLPILIELARLPKRYLHPEEGEVPNWLLLLPAFLTKQQGFESIPALLFTQALQEGRCLLLLDGLDEIPHQQVRLRLMRSLIEFVRLHSHNRLIVGSRPSGVSGSTAILHPWFKQCQIERFTAPNMLTFFSNWCALDTMRSSDEQMAEAVHLSQQVQVSAYGSIARTPLLTTLLFLFWRRTGTLPERRVDLYKQCCQMFVANWEPNHDVPFPGSLAQLSGEQQLRLLSIIAYTLHQQEQQGNSSRTVLVTILAQSLIEEQLCSSHTAAQREAERILTSLGERSGLLHYLGNDHFYFPHHSFQEYLAAYYLSFQKNVIELVMEHLHEAWWEEVHVLTMGILGSASTTASQAKALLSHLLSLSPPPHPFFRSSNHPFRRLITPGRYFSWIQYDRHINWFLAKELQLAMRGYIECRPDTVALHIETQLSSAFVSFITRAAADSTLYFVQYAVITELCSLIKNSHTLLKMLLQEKNTGIRRIAVECLGQVLRYQNEEETRSMVRQDWRFLETIWNVQRNPEEQFTQSMQQNSATVATLLHALEDPSSLVREIAAQSLGYLRKKNHSVVTALLRALQDTNENVRIASTESLGYIGKGSNETLDGLVLAFKKGEPFLQLAILQSLAQWEQKNQQITEVLLDALQEKTVWLRIAAAQILRDMNMTNSEVIEAFVHLLKDPDQLVQALAEQTLAQWGPSTPQIVDTLEQETDPQKQKLLTYIKRVIQTMKGSEELLASGFLPPYVLSDIFSDPETVEILSVHDSPFTKLFYEGTFVSLNDNSLLHSWREADDGTLRKENKLWDTHIPQEFSLAQQAAPFEAEDLTWSFARVDPDADISKRQWIIEKAVRSLQSAQPHTRKLAAEMLGVVGKGIPEAIQALLRALEDPHPGVIRKAVTSLGTVGKGQESVLPALLRALQIPNTDIQQEVAKSLGMIGIPHPNVIDALLRFIPSPTTSVDNWMLFFTTTESLGLLGIGNAKVIDAFLHALQRPSSSIRNRAIEIVGKVGADYPKVAETFLQMLKKADFESTWAIVKSLGATNITDESLFFRILLALNRCLYQGPDELRQAALISIQRLLKNRPFPRYHPRTHRLPNRSILR